jgi:hypothetical protein
MSRLSLINPQGPCPPDGFRYVDPVDGWECHAWSYNDWVELYTRHLQANGREVPCLVGLLMQDQLCRTLPPGWCNYDDPGRRRASGSLDWGDMAAGVATFTRWIAAGAEYVSQDEASRRALICSRCYLNMNISGCSNCHKAAAEVTKNRKTKYDFALKGCGACKCLLSAKVHFPVDILNKDMRNVQEIYPSHCWAKQTSPNYRG